MSYVKHNLLDNEHIVFQTARHWVIFLVPAAFSIVALFLFTLSSVWILLGYLFLFMGIVQWISAMITYSTSEYAVTNKRVVIKIGFIRRLSYETLLQRVAGIQVNQNVLARMLDYGTVIIYGTGGEKESFVGIEEPLLFRRRVQEQIEAAINPRESEQFKEIAP